MCSSRGEEPYEQLKEKNMNKQYPGESDSSFYRRSARSTQNFNASPREKTEIDYARMEATVPHSINLAAAKRRLVAKGYKLTCLGSTSWGQHYKLENV